MTRTADAIASGAMRLSRARVLAAAAALPRIERRRPRGIVVWTTHHDALLGLASDAVLADAWNLRCFHVWRRRNLLGILPCGHQPPTVIRWTAAMIRALGSMTDVAFAKRYGMSKASASLKRTSLNIQRARHPQTVVWTPAMVRLLGRHLDQEVARRLGLCTGTVSAKRRALGIARVVATKADWTTRHIRRLLGTASDGDIARRLGVTVETVRIRRTQAGIPPFAPLQWTPAIIARMGTVPDRVLAAEMGATPSAVAWQRRRLGIRTWDPRYHPRHR